MEKLELFRRYSEEINRWYALQSRVEEAKERGDVPDPEISAASKRSWRTFLELTSEIEEQDWLNEYFLWSDQSKEKE